MKKLIIFIAMALMAVSANAQTSLLKVNYEGVTEFTHWFGSNEGTDATLEMVADGVAINNPRVQDQIWTPQAVMTDDCLTLEEDYNYIVRITLKVPSDGSYQVQFGSWSTNFQYEVPVTASDEWQTIDVEFPEFGGTVEGDGHVVFQCGWVVGKTIIKEVQVIGELDNTTFNPANIKYNYIAKGKVAEVISNNGKYRGIVEIPAKVTYEGEEYTVTKICDNAFSDCKRLSSIIIPNSVTSIGSYAFSGCSSLTSVTIPNSVTSIGDGIFQNCYNLTSIIIPNSVTSIGSYAFSGCSSLTSITIPNSVTSIGSYAFHCSGLTSVIIPNSVKSLGSCAFYGCSGLTSLIIGKNVISISEDAFNGCKSLESIVIESGNNVYDSRNGCNAIINSEANLLILGCKNTTLPNSITSIGSNAFAGCDGLTSVVIPNGVVSIGSYAFKNCKELTSVTIPNSVTSIGYYAFQSCTKLNSISAPNSYVNDGAFYGCSSLTSVTFTGATVGSYAFAYCPELKDVYYLLDVALYEKDPGFSWYVGSYIFQDSYIEYATLHVPAASLSIYKNAEPWKNFMKVVALSDSDIPETPETPKCATPTISYNNGVITFSCETEGAEFISEVKANDNRKEYDNKIILSNTYTVSVYATKAGYDNSETVTMEVIGTGGILGDLTGDGKVDVADHVKLSDIIMGK